MIISFILYMNMNLQYINYEKQAEIFTKVHSLDLTGKALGGNELFGFHCFGCHCETYTMQCILIQVEPKSINECTFSEEPNKLPSHLISHTTTCFQLKQQQHNLVTSIQQRLLQKYAIDCIETKNDAIRHNDIKVDCHLRVEIGVRINKPGECEESK